MAPDNSKLSARWRSVTTTSRPWLTRVGAWTSDPGAVSGYRDSAASSYGFILHPGCSINAQTLANRPFVVGTAAGSNPYFVGGVDMVQSDVDAITTTAPLSNNNTAAITRKS
jgi:hypothetical protein